MKKIAPMLASLVEDASKVGLGYYPEKARKEIRALLSVARAAQVYLRADIGSAERNTFALARALDRLAKVSR